MLRNLLSVASVIVVLGAFYLSGCSQSNKVMSTKTSGNGIALLKIAIAQNSPFQRIVKKATVTISGSDMNTMNQNLTITDSTVEGTVIGIPAGKNRLFYIGADDSLGTLQYSGSTIANIIADSTVNISITITRISGNANVNVNVNESDTIPTNGLVAYYPFNGNANDASGNGNNGIVFGATFTTDRFSQANNALSFDGVESYVDLGMWFTLPIFSLSIWVNPAATQGLHADIIDNNHTNSQNWVVQSVNTLGTESYIFFGNSASSGNEADTFNMTAGKWNHIVISREALKTTVYINGQITGTLANSGSVIYNGTQHLHLGMWNSNQPSDGGQRFWKGIMDDVRIYNRALSSIEVSSLYYNGGWAGN